MTYRQGSLKIWGSDFCKKASSSIRHSLRFKFYRNKKMFSTLKSRGLDMPCPMCNARTKAGRPCRHKTCKYAPKCMHHTKVRVAPSAIHGQGVFAKTDMPRGTAFANYTLGTKALTAGQFRAAYPTGRATHVWQHPSGTYYDATDGNTSIAGMANRAPRGGRNNAKIARSGQLVTTRRVRAGSELLVTYGSAFRT